MSFDLSVYDVFGILSAGGTIIIPEETELKDPDKWLQYVEDEGVTLWNSVPALMQMFVDTVENKDLHLGLYDNWDKDHKHYLDWLFTKWLGVGAKPMDKEDQAFTLLKRSDFVDLQKYN